MPTPDPCVYRRSSRLLARLLVLCLAAALLVLPPSGSAEASGAESAADFSTALARMDGLYDGYGALEAAIKLEKAEIRDLRAANDLRQQRITAAVKLIDKAVIDRLSAAAAGASAGYAPLLQQYADLGKRATAARGAKDKKSADLLDLQRNRMKPAVTAARQEIADAKAALAEAKKTAAAKAAAVREALAPVAALRKQITAENGKIASANKTRTAAGKRYRSAVKAGLAMTAATEMAIMYRELGRIHACWQNMYGWEKQISGVLAAAEAKLPK
ncbi:hypothetical protein [Paenibacillus glufosinatiresistens]|uniref:hypothetical protein n=1 Tax=Paenibacillus glufosinatiresistens TaxID=3070657 RepID=UPI00286E50C6|nr:hypothetical protein [Paenibacillus sp. YX.27]